MAAPPLLLPPRRRPAEERALYSTQAEIAREQWDEYKRLGVPIQESLAAEASAPISESEYATNIGRAGADVDQAYDQAGTEFRSSLGRYGLNPGSGRFASGLRSLALGRAADKSGAMTGARGALQNRRDRLRHGVLAGLQGQAGQAQAGLASAAGGYGGIVNRAQRAQESAQQARGNRQFWVWQLAGHRRDRGSNRFFPIPGSKTTWARSASSTAASRFIFPLQRQPEGPHGSHGRRGQEYPAGGGGPAQERSRRCRLHEGCSLMASFVEGLASGLSGLPQALMYRQDQNRKDAYRKDIAGLSSAEQSF